MLRVGLTGGIACGKSTIGKMLEQRGAHLLLADELAHRLYAPGTRAARRDRAAFRTAKSLREDGTIVRKRLADVVFPDRIAELNALVHPAVIEAQQRWMADIERSDPGGIAVVEAALLIEAGAHKDFDKVIVVICGTEQKVERYAERAGISLEAARAEAERRSAAQFSDDEKARYADYVIENSGSLANAERQVEEVWTKLQSR